jgi:hypothetical protein
VRAFAAGTAVGETPLRGRRFIGVGHIRRADGSRFQQLIVVGVRHGRNFHQKIHFPNYLCAFFVRADNPSEIASVGEALAALAAGTDPTVSSAYRWGLTYALPTDGECVRFQRSADGFLVGDGSPWELRAAGAGIAFAAHDWQAAGNELIVHAPREAAPP